METIPAKSLIQKPKKPIWFGADYNMNIYRGCTHGCIYCDSRSDCYNNPDFETIKAKESALQIIRDELRRKVRSGVIATGSMSDPYNSFERDARLTRNALELINAYEFGVAIATKSALVTRDLDILRDIQTHSPVIVKITITTADDALGRKLEPNVSSASERFAALRQLSEAGIFCGVLMMPILPFINDTAENVAAIADKAAAAGARFVYPAMGMTLRAGNREYYYRRLDALFPGLKEKYVRTFGDRYTCVSPDAEALWDVFAKRCREHRLLYKMDDITHAYQRGYEGQLSLLNFRE